MRSIMRTLLIGVLAATVGAGMLFASAQTESAKASESRLKDVGFRATGLPIVDKQIAVDAAIVRHGQTLVPFAEMSLVKKLQEMTNIKVNFMEIPQAQQNEKVNLMFASRSFPDVLFDVGGIDANLWQAVQGGDVTPLDDLIEKYAPNWKQAFKDEPRLRREIVFPDGKVYSLPYTRNIQNDYMIRDIQAINVSWLKTLGLKMPTTTDEFYEVLKGFRKGIDDGRLPKGSVPWCLIFHNTIGGEFEIYGAFGMYVYDAGFISVNNGKVECALTNPRLIDVMDYMHKLYVEKLIPEEMFTDSWNTYLSKTRANPPIAGYWGSYFIPEPNEPDFDPLPPLKGPGVTKPIFRSQAVRVEKNQYTIMKKCAYPEAMIRFADFTADDLWSIQLSYGPIGVTIDDNKDGTYTARGISEEYTKHAPHNFFPAYISRRISEKIKWTRDQGRREEYVEKVYKPYVWPQERHFPRVTFSDQEQQEIPVLQQEIRNYTKATLAGWITKGGAKEGWDAYIKQLEKLGLPKYLQIYQAAYDRFASK